MGGGWEEEKQIRHPLRYQCGEELNPGLTRAAQTQVAEPSSPALVGSQLEPGTPIQDAGSPHGV